LKKPIARHFNSKGHSIKCLRATILETIPKNPESELTTSFRRRREYYWLHKLRTLEPIGLNSMGWNQRCKGPNIPPPPPFYTY
jgi:hypothetical protein